LKQIVSPLVPNTRRVTEQEALSQNSKQYCGTICFLVNYCMGYKIDYDVGLFYKDCLIQVGDSTITMFGVYMSRIRVLYVPNASRSHLESFREMQRIVDAVPIIIGDQIDFNGLVRWYYDCLDECLYLARQDDCILLKLVL
jgi:hypothetical protein